MISVRSILTAVAMTAVLCACSDDSNRDTIGRAEDAFTLGNYTVAQNICDSLISGVQFDDLTVDQLCRLTILTSRLAEEADEESNIALAARCMQSALRRQPDSVFYFIQSLPADEQSGTLLIQQLTRSLDRDTTDTSVLDIHDEPHDDSQN